MTTRHRQHQYLPEDSPPRWNLPSTALALAVLTCLLLPAPARADDDKPVNAREIMRAARRWLRAEGAEEEDLALTALQVAGGLHADPAVLEKAVRDAASSRRRGRKGFTDGKVPARDAENPALRYRLFVPRQYDPRKAWPILLGLHPAGSDARTWLQVWHAEAPRGAKLTAESKRLYRQAEAHGWLVVAPQQPANTRWEQNDEAITAALRCLDHVRERWNVDPDRVVVDGFSSGGGGAWRMGLRFADRLAGAVPRAGGVDPSYLENLTRLPLYVIHGREDADVPFSWSEQAVAGLKKLRPDHPLVFRALTGGHHFFPDEHAAILDWADPLRRDSHPERITWWGPGSGQPGSRAWWLDLLETQSLGRVEAKVHSAENRIEVTSEQVTSLRLRLSERLLDLGRPVVVDWNGERVHEEVVHRDLETLLRHVRDTADPARVYGATLELKQED